jgi:hypothetical protein
MTGGEPGVYEVDVPTSTSGIYRILVTARGVDLRGAAFTATTRPPLTIDPTRGSGGTLDLCGHLTRILGDEAVRRFLAKHELDPDRITECVKVACR